MKKIYFLALFAFVAFTMNAQVSVTFSVDMNDAALADGDIVTLGGDFQTPAMWTPGAEVFTDEDGNGVYVFTYDGLMPGQLLKYKYVINGWGTNEFGTEGAEPGDCNEDDGSEHKQCFNYPSCEIHSKSSDRPYFDFFRKYS